MLEAFFVFFCFLLWVGFGLGLRSGGCCVVVGSGWIKCFFGYWVVVVFVESGVEILSDRAAAMLSCREADDTVMKKERKKEKRRDDKDNLTLTYISYQVLIQVHMSTLLFTKNRPEILGITDNIPRISQKSQQR